jgi:hypothetical protein
MRAAVARGLAAIDAQRRAMVRIVVDVDPISML